MIHDPVDCEALVGLVTDWLEGDVDEPTRSDLELHVATCAGCIAYVEQMRLTRTALARLELVDVISRPGSEAEAAPSDPDAPSDQVRNDLLAIFRARRG